MTTITTTSTPTTTLEPASGTPRGMLWTGRVLTTLITLFMLFDGGAKVAKVQQVVDGTKQAGFPESAVRPIGAACLAGAILYAIPQTSVLGAILLTAFFGGAVATHVHMGDGMWWFAVVFGVLTWFGIFLRDARLRRLIPLRQVPA